MRPFESNPHCEKCDKGAQVAHGLGRDEQGEFLAYKCWACGWSWESLTADYRPARNVNVEVIETRPTGGFKKWLLGR